MQSPVVQAPPKPTIIGTADPTDKQTAKDKSIREGKDVVGSGGGITSDAHTATGGDGGKTEKTNSALSPGSDDIKPQPGDNRRGGSLEIVVSPAI